MIQSKEKEINGAVYTATTFPARKAITTGTKLFRFLGPALGELFGSLETEEDVPVGLKPDALSKAVKMLVDGMDSNKVVALILEILGSTTRIDPAENKRQEVCKPHVFDEVYAANFGELFGALAFALEVSLGDFLGNAGISKLLDKAKAMTGRLQSPEASQTESTQD